MKHILTLLTVGVLLAFVTTGCQSPKGRSASGTTVAQSTRNNCYSLLYQLLNDQKNVSMLRFIKRENSDVKKLVNNIAVNSAAGAKLLEAFATEDSSIRLDDIRLPPGEQSTRDAIASSKEKELLRHTGAEFELALLLTQAEALSYGWHLAKVAGEHEPQVDRAGSLSKVSDDMENLYNQVFVLLLSRTK